MLHVTGLTKSYRTAGEQVAVLRGVNLTVAAGESVALTGESGSGKSTLLHLIAGLDAADGGEIRLADAQVSELSDAGRAELRRDRLGLVFQQFNLIPSLTVEDNFVFQSRIAGRHDAAWHHELVERLGLGNFLKRYPEQLSGGQQQRVAIGRALAVKPLLLLADEPTGNLDEDTADEVLALARDLVTRSGCGFLMVTHSAKARRHARPAGQPPCRGDRVKRALWTLAVLLSHWRRHPMQLATLLIGLISATALWSGVQALNQQARTSYDRAAATFGGTRTAMLVARSGASFPQKLFVDLRRAGWPVSPVLEGRIQIEGRSFRLLGIEPVTLPAEVGNAPAIGRADLQSFMTPPGAMLVAPETLSDLKLAEGARPASQWRRIAAAASRAAEPRARRIGRRHRHRAEPFENAGSALAPPDRQDGGQARDA